MKVDLSLLAPHIFLFSWAILIFVFDFFWNKEKKHNLGYLSLVGIAATFFLNCLPLQGGLFGNMFLSDDFSRFFNLIFLGAAFLAVLSSIDYLKNVKYNRGEYFSLILLSTVGMMLLSSANELLFLYVSLELTTISLYVLVAYLKDDYKSSEAGLKYLILGAVSSAILLYGISIIYGLTGTTSLYYIPRAIAAVFLNTFVFDPALVLGLIFLIAGFSFKLALVPFHMWAPDVYEGAPTPITAYLSIASKTAGLVAFIRVFFQSFLILQIKPVEWISLIAILAAFSMILGNIVALSQTNIKRMLAYSSIAQVGYILIGVVAASATGIASIGFYVLVYLFANMGAFIIAIVFSRFTNSDNIPDYAGLSKRSPFLGILMSIFMLSLVGIPPLAGFAGKYYLFSAAIEQGYIWLVVVAILTSVISLYYYAGVIKQMYFSVASDQSSIKTTVNLKVALIICVAGVLACGIYPQPFIQLAQQAAAIFHY